jgi:putative Mn2+ efflux pump MntP
MDAFAVAVAAGLTVHRLTGRHVFRLAWHFGLFQFMMPVLGWFAGRTVSSRIAAYDHWVAFALLAAVGAKMLHDAFAHGDDKPRSDPTRGLRLVTLSVATSLDALAVGLSMAFLDVSIWLPSAVIGVVAAGMTTVGLCFGSRLGRRMRHWAEGTGGVVLVLIGLRILISHLSAGG